MLNNRNIWLQLMTKHHNKLITSHLSDDKILELLSQNYLLSNTRKYIKTYIAICNVCTREKVIHYKLFGLLQLLPILDKAQELVLTNFIVKLLTSRDPSQLKEEEFDSIQVVVDRLIKMMHLILYNELITSKQLAYLYMSYIFVRYSMPKMIIFD